MLKHVWPFLILCSFAFQITFCFRLGTKVYQNHNLKSNSVLSDTNEIFDISAHRLIFKSNVAKYLAKVRELKDKSYLKELSSDLSDLESSLINLSKLNEGSKLIESTLYDVKRLYVNSLTNERPFLTNSNENLLSLVERMPLSNIDQMNYGAQRGIYLAKQMSSVVSDSTIDDSSKNIILASVERIGKSFDHLKTIFSNIKSSLTSHEKISFAYQKILNNKKEVLTDEITKNSEYIHKQTNMQLVWVLLNFALTLLYYVSNKKDQSETNEQFRNIVMNKDVAILEQNKFFTQEEKKSIKEAIELASGQAYLSDLISESVPFPMFIVNEHKKVVWANRALKDKTKLDDQIIKQRLMHKDQICKILESHSQVNKGQEEITFYADTRRPECSIGIVHQNKNLKNEVLESEIPPLPLECRTKKVNAKSFVNLNNVFTETMLLLTRSMMDYKVSIDLSIDDDIEVKVVPREFKQLIQTMMTHLIEDNASVYGGKIKISGRSKGKNFELNINPTYEFREMNSKEIFQDILFEMSAQAGVDVVIEDNKIRFTIALLAGQLQSRREISV